MSKSMKRVSDALLDAGVDVEILEMPDDTRTAQLAATAAGCEVNQIAKSIIFKGEQSARAVLFITAGGNQVDVAKASALAGEPLGKADANLIRGQTGFAIGGVSPIGHLSEIRAFFDPDLLKFGLVWAAAGTPHHIFAIEPQVLQEISSAYLSDFT